MEYGIKQIFQLNFVSDIESLINKIDVAYQKNEQLIINYININSIISINENLSFRKVIGTTDILFQDGTGIYLTLKYLFNKECKNFNLTDHVDVLKKYLIKKKIKVFLLGSEDKTLKKAVKSLKKEAIHIVGSANGYEDLEEKELVKKIELTNPNIILVGLGTPKQENWIFQNKIYFPNKILISVGDLFSEIAGVKKRGPKFIRKMGFEWLFRVIYKPLTYGQRYILGIPKYLYLLLKSRIS